MQMVVRLVRKVLDNPIIVSEDTISIVGGGILFFFVKIREINIFIYESVLI
ncbi:hypothetical protein D3C74_468400 [compost metagenome]